MPRAMLSLARWAGPCTCHVFALDHGQMVQITSIRRVAMVIGMVTSVPVFTRSHQVMVTDRSPSSNHNHADHVFIQVRHIMIAYRSPGPLSLLPCRHRVYAPLHQFTAAYSTCANTSLVCWSLCGPLLACRLIRCVSCGCTAVLRHLWLCIDARSCNNGFRVMLCENHLAVYAVLLCIDFI